MQMAHLRLNCWSRYMNLVWHSMFDLFITQLGAGLEALHQAPRTCSVRGQASLALRQVLTGKEAGTPRCACRAVL